MKNRFFCILMTGALACGSPFALHAQTDVTDTYLVNPSFETYLEGWEFDDLLPQSNDGLVTKDGPPTSRNGLAPATPLAAAA